MHLPDLGGYAEPCGKWFIKQKNLDKSHLEFAELLPRASIFEEQQKRDSKAEDVLIMEVDVNTDMASMGSTGVVMRGKKWQSTLEGWQKNKASASSTSHAFPKSMHKTS